MRESPLFLAAAYTWKLLDARWRLGRPVPWRDAFGMMGPWVRSLRSSLSPLDLGLPWIACPAIRRLEREPLPLKQVLEYGAGGSTLFLAGRSERVTTVEHDPDWARRVREELEWRRLDHAEIVLLPPERDPSLSGGDAADPDGYCSGDRRYEGARFRAYASYADRFPDGHFDLVLVDGRARPSCLRHAAPKVRPGGLLILDNVERPHYLARAGDCLRGWTRRDCPGPAPGSRALTVTALYRAPLAP